MSNPYKIVFAIAAVLVWIYPLSFAAITWEIFSHADSLFVLFCGGVSAGLTAWYVILSVETAKQAASEWSKKEEQNGD